MTIAIGLVGLAMVWWLDGGGPAETQVASAAATLTSDVALAAPAAPGTSPPAVQMAQASVFERTLPPAEAFDSMVDRPLFAPDRRPIAPDEVQVDLPLPELHIEPAAGPAYPAMSFIGSIEEAGHIRALLGDGLSVRGVEVGDTVDGWTVLEIEARRLTLGHDDEVLELTILQ